jgi:two-component system sensor histidine kinase SenX3
LVKIGNTGQVAALIFDDSEANRLDAVRRDFVANISHELKTPIGGISILAEAISEGSDDPVLVKNFSERMKIEADRLKNLVQEIIDLSRIQGQDTMQNAKFVNLKLIVEEAIYQSKVRAEKKNIQINFAADEEIEFFGDKKQLVMAISNLIENAINYSPERTEVSVVLRKNEGFAEIAIKDQGVGIAEGDIERIFERFYRVDSARSRETGGTGLGLSIVKHVISNHGGEIQALERSRNRQHLYGSITDYKSRE